MIPAIRALLLLPVLLQAPAPATGFKVSGRVVDGETGKPLAGAIVTIRKESGPAVRTASAGQNGSFQLENVASGHYRLTAEHPNPVFPYRSSALEIEILNRDVEDLGLIVSPAIPRTEILGRVTMSNGGALPAALSTLKFSEQSIELRRDGSFQTRLRPLEKYELTLGDAPEGFYVASVSGGIWDPVRGTWSFRDKPAGAVQITLDVGRRRITGRVLNTAKAPSPQASATLVGPEPSTSARQIVLGPGATFSIGGLRPGTYELKAKMGAGEATQAGSLAFTVDAQDLLNLDLALKAMSPFKGQILLPGSFAMSELLRFKPYIEIVDATGWRSVTVDSNGAFQFRSFEGDFRVEVRNLPIELRVDSIETNPASINIRLRTFQDAPPSFDRRFRR